MDRRQFHRWTQAIAWAWAFAPWLARAQTSTGAERNWKTQPFQLGVASGSPRHDSVVIWTRLLIADADQIGRAHV